MKRLVCPNREELAAYLLGTLPDETWTWVAGHSGSCPDCQALLLELDPTSDSLLRQLRAPYPRTEPSDEAELDRLLLKAESTVLPLDDSVPLGSTVAAWPESRGPKRELPADICGLMAPPQEPDEIGRIGFYSVRRMLGQGGMGLVFEAEDPVLRRIVALKVMRPSAAAITAARERFLREARAAAAIEHDHIVAIYQVGEEGGVPFLAMPLLEGMSLEARLRPEATAGKASLLPVREILRIGREIASGLAAAHAVGLIHRDVKPANIWLDARHGDRVKLLDFGLARPADDDVHLTQSGLIVGTPAYMAPEQSRGEALDARADLFSLGCVLYRLCTGRLPFKRPDAVATLVAVATEVPPAQLLLNPDLPPALSDLVMRLLAKNPNDRPASAEAVIAAIRTVEREGLENPGSENVLELTQTLVSPRLRRLWPWFAAAAAIVALLATSTVIYLKTDNGLLEIQADDQVKVMVDGKQLRVIDRKSGKQVAELDLTTGKQSLKLGSGEYELRIDGPVEWSKNPVSIKRGETELVVVRSALTQQLPFPRWLASVRELPALQQLRAVMNRLREHNPGFDGGESHSIEDGVVTELAFDATRIEDLKPVQALVGLRVLTCGAPEGARSKLADLSPLRGLSLKALACYRTDVADLMPLRGMKLSILDVAATRVSNLTPLRDMPLTSLHCWDTPVADLTPLRNMPLTFLNCSGTQVADLTPLRGLSLGLLNCADTPIADLAPLQGMPLTQLYCYRTQVKDLTALQGMKLLAHLDLGGTKVSSLDPLRGMTLAELYCWGTQVADLGPLAATPLKELNCSSTPVRDLTPLRALKLTMLDCGLTEVSDLSPLKDMPLTLLLCHKTQVADLTPLHGMPLEELDLHGTPVSDLAPLKGAPLRNLRFWGTSVADLGPLQGMRLNHLDCGGTKVSSLAPLKDMPLTSVYCWGTAIEDLVPLQGTKLSLLHCNGCAIRDLTPLRGLKIVSLNLADTQVADLAPLKGMPLIDLNCVGTRVSDLAPLQSTTLQHLWCGFKPERDAQVLKAIKTLKTINDQPAAKLLN